MSLYLTSQNCSKAFIGERLTMGANLLMNLSVVLIVRLL